MFEIVINGKKVVFEKNITLYDYLKSNNYNIDRIVIEKDKKVLKKSLWNNTFLKDGNCYEIIEFVGGG